MKKLRGKKNEKFIRLGLCPKPRSIWGHDSDGNDFPEKIQATLKAAWNHVAVIGASACTAMID